ncbi:MAG: hypothetical protein V4850_30510 [Myxococcota bacterium]
MTPSTTAPLHRGRPLSASIPGALGAYRDHTDDVAFFERGTLQAARELDTDHPPARAALLGWRTDDGDIQWDLHVCGVAWFTAVVAELSCLPLAAPAVMPYAGPARASGEPVPGPISTWLQIASAIGVDDSTIRAHRRRTRDQTRPLFESAEAARRWYADLVAAPDYTEPERRRRKRASAKPSPSEGAVDWSKVEV